MDPISVFNTKQLYALRVMSDFALTIACGFITTPLTIWTARQHVISIQSVARITGEPHHSVYRCGCRWFWTKRRGGQYPACYCCKHLIINIQVKCVVSSGFEDQEYTQEPFFIPC